MQEIDVPAGFSVSSYEKGGRFVVLFAAAVNPNPTSDLRSIAVTMTPDTLNDLTDYLREPGD